MRTGTLPRLLATTMLSLVALLVAPALAAAQSSGTPIVSMTPASAGAGATVEVSGSGFPRDTTVALRLATEAGITGLDVAATQADGSFTRVVTLPAVAETGAWELQARAADGTAASYSFDPTAVVATAAGAGSAGRSATHGNSPGDIAVLLIMGLILGLIAIAGLYIWQMSQGEPARPGMGAGDDLIWGQQAEAAGLARGPELTASDEPFWMVAGTATAAEPAATAETDTEPATDPLAGALASAPADANVEVEVDTDVETESAADRQAAATPTADQAGEPEPQAGSTADAEPGRATQQGPDAARTTRDGPTGRPKPRPEQGAPASA